MLENVLTGLHADAANAEREQEVAVQGNVEVGSERQEMRVEPWEQL